MRIVMTEEVKRWAAKRKATAVSEACCQYDLSLSEVVEEDR